MNHHPFSFDATMIILADDGSMVPEPRPAGGVAVTGPALGAPQLVSMFSYDRTWPYRERHPTGDELVAVIEGEAEVLLQEHPGDEPCRVRLATGQACIVPAGWWHRAACVGPATFVFITPTPGATEHRPDP